MRQGRKKALVLLVEHDPSNIAARALEQVQVPHEVVRVSSGTQADGFLSGTGVVGGPPRRSPKVVLIDMSRPLEPQVETLRVIRAHPLSMLAPVVILAESASDEEVRVAYQAGANSFLCKPSDERAAIDTIAMVATYWIELNLPANPEGTP